MFAASPPGYPGRRPDRARNPDPAVIRRVEPAAVVITSPTPGVFRDKHPAHFGAFPVAVRVRAPVAWHILRVPDPAVANRLHPTTVRFECFMETLNGDRRGFGLWLFFVDRHVDFGLANLDTNSQLNLTQPRA